MQELGTGLKAMTFGVFDLALDLFEGRFHRREQIFNGTLALIDVGRRFGAGLAEARLGKLEKRFVVRFQRRGAQCLKRVAQRRSRAKPSDEYTKRHPDQQRAHEFHAVTSVSHACPDYRATTNGSQLSGSCSSAA